MAEADLAAGVEGTVAGRGIRWVDMSENVSGTHFHKVIGRRSYPCLLHRN